MFSSITKKMIMAVTGIVLSSFILVHLAGNVTIFGGGEAFLSYAEYLHSLGFILVEAEIFLLIFFVLHVFFGVTLFFENLSARSDSYSVSKSQGGRSIGSMTMIYTGVIVFIFLGVHLTTLSFSTVDLNVLELLTGYLGQPMMVGIYVTGLFALTLHISHGLWSMFQTFGINHPKYDCLIKRATLFIALAVGAVYISIPILIYFRGIPGS